MVDRVHPTQGEASSQLTSGAIKWAASSDWIVPSGTDYLAAFAGLSGTPLNGFGESHSSSSYDVTIDTGEGFVGGRWMARDTTTTVTLASSTTNQTVYAGWESSTADSVVIGLDSAFSSSDGGRRTAIWEFDTDGSGVTSSTKVHNNEQIHPHAADSDALAGIDASNFARTDMGEYFSQSIDVAADTTTSQLVVVNDDNTGWRIGTGSATSTTPFIAPRIGGDTLFGGDLEHNGSKWEFGDEVLIGGDDAVTSSSGNYDIQKNGTDGIGVINFKT